MFIGDFDMTETEEQLKKFLELYCLKILSRSQRATNLICQNV